MEVGLEFRHACSFCGWARASATPVMLSPSCERCGCRLDAQVADPTPAGERLSAMPARATAAMRTLAMLLGALALYAAANLGYHAAGAAGAMIAFGLGGYLMLPFVPERLDGPR
jgi:hypothetical protein